MSGGPRPGDAPALEFRVEVVMVPVSDVDRAKAFYADLLGFPVDLDVSRGDDFRMVQLTPPGSGCSIAFGTEVSQMAPGSLKGVQICVADIEAAHAALVARGAPVGPVQRFEDGRFVDGKGGDWNSWIRFEDPDGNEWAIQESPVMRAELEPVRAAT